jgi:hypothetical protein
MAYSMDFRFSVTQAYDECGSSIEVAEQFNCSESWVPRLMQPPARAWHAGGKGVIPAYAGNK